MRALGSFLIVLIQAENSFEGFMTIEANIIVDGHENLPRENPLKELYARCRY